MKNTLQEQTRKKRDFNSVPIRYTNVPKKCNPNVIRNTLL